MVLFDFVLVILIHGDRYYVPLRKYTVPEYCFFVILGQLRRGGLLKISPRYKFTLNPIPHLRCQESLKIYFCSYRENEQFLTQKKLL